MRRTGPAGGGVAGGGVAAAGVRRHWRCGWRRLGRRARSRAHEEKRQRAAAKGRGDRSDHVRQLQVQEPDCSEHAGPGQGGDVRGCGRTSRRNRRGPGSARSISPRPRRRRCRRRDGAGVATNWQLSPSNAQYVRAAVSDGPDSPMPLFPSRPLTAIGVLGAALLVAVPAQTVRAQRRSAPAALPVPGRRRPGRCRADRRAIPADRGQHHAGPRPRWSSAVRPALVRRRHPPLLRVAGAWRGRGRHLGGCRRRLRPASPVGRRAPAGAPGQRPVGSRPPPRAERRPVAISP